MSEEIKDGQTITDSQHQTASYRSIFKATSLFGGVQVFQIVIGVIKSKFIAVLLGPLGLGILGLYQSALSFIQSLTSMGLSTSAVRNVSEAYATGDNKRIALIIQTLKRLVLYTGLLGVLVVICISPFLSQSSFGDKNHIIPFICLSVTLLIDQIAAGQRVVLQGTRKLNELAKASAIGATLSLLLSIPLYYKYGLKSIVPTLILNSFSILLLTWFYSKKVPINRISISHRQAINEGKDMLKMGLALSYSGILVYGCGYILRWFIRENAGTEMVGLYTAGFTIINSYVGMIFTAIGTDFYPRLAAVNKNNNLMKVTVNQQGEIASLIMAPLLQICVLFMPLMIRILYSQEFLEANDFVLYATLGMMFRLGSWLIAYQFIAKGNSRVYIINETAANVYSIILSMVGFKLWGLSGLGIAFTVGYLFYYIQVYYVANRLYEYTMSIAFKRVFYIQMFLLAASLVIVLYFGGLTSYFLGGLIIIISGFLAIKGLEEKLGLVQLMKKKIK